MRIGVAKMLHKFPHEVDEMLWEDAVLLMAFGEIEQEKHKPARGQSGPGTRVTNFIVRPKESPRGT